MKYYQECIALGSKTGLCIVSDQSPSVIRDIYAQLWKTIFTFERKFSRFIPDSELSAFNKRAGFKQSVSPEFIRLLKIARSFAMETEELFNPFILPALHKQGYIHSRVTGNENDLVDDYSEKSVATVNKLEVGEGWARIPYDTAIDFGGFGKGYLADQLVKLLPSHVTGYWFSLGGDVAIGGLDDSKQPWEVCIEQADKNSNQILISKQNEENAIATSGTIIHKGLINDKPWHHIIDPRTKESAITDVIMATVTDVSALRADVFASCAIILGHNKAIDFLRDKGVKRAIIQYYDSDNNIEILQYDKQRQKKEVYA